MSADADRELKAAIAENLEGMGFSVQHLDERESDKTPDFLAVKSERFLIEVKEKGDDPSKLEAEAERAREGGIAERHEYWGPKNTVARIIKDGSRQLAAWPEEERDYCLLWLHASGRDPESQYEQFRGTLLGVTNIIEMGKSTMKECYFFHDSAFFRWRQTLDGAIVSSAKEAELWLNPHSSRADRLKASELTAAFGGANDPRDLEAQGTIFIADCEVDRRDSDAVKRYLQEKYRTKPLDNMHVGCLTAIYFFGEEE